MNCKKWLRTMLSGIILYLSDGHSSKEFVDYDD